MSRDLSQTVLFLSCIFRLAVASRLEMASKKSKALLGASAFYKYVRYSGLRCVQS